MHYRVQRIAREAGAGLDVVPKRGRIGRELQDVVQVLCAVAHAQHLAQLAEAAAGEAVA